jgi:conserved oligomeric Golgi complex subunit 3
LEVLCGSLYDELRPLIIHINHLETLAELCSILRLEMLEEHVHANRNLNNFKFSNMIKSESYIAEPLAAFGRLAWQLLQDVQERLVFRAHLYLKSDIEQYKAAPGDLAYPEKLEMMEVIWYQTPTNGIEMNNFDLQSIALSLQQEGQNTQTSTPCSRTGSKT